MNRIMLVDDDLVLTRYYVVALQLQGYRVDVFNNPDDVLSSDFDDCVLLISDLMMPSGASFPESESQNGMLTGVLLIESMRAKGFKAPCAILTNLNMSAVMKEVSRRIAVIENVVVMRKSEFNSIEFARVVDAVISGDMRKKLSPSILKRLADSLLLKPTFFGVGLDLKRLWGVKE